jgi:hypothetical protein
VAISDIAATADTPRRPARCGVCNALDSLPAKESKALLSLLANPAVRYVALSEELAADKDYPLDLHYEVLRRHARGRCAARTMLRAAVTR